jgi:RimJ/RimL family protein N-acetyltransferase
MLSLRDMTTDDLDIVVKWRCDPVVNQYLADRLKSRDSVHPWFTRLRLDPKIWLKIILHNDLPVGYGVIESIDEKSRKCEIGLCIGETGCWGNGIGTSVVKSMLRHAFEELRLHRVVGVVMQDNKRSERMLKRLGFAYEGTMRDAMYTAGTFRHLHWYAMLETDYENTYLQNTETTT